MKEQHMTPQHASQSHGQVRRTGVETIAADADQAISTGTSASAEQASDVDSILDEIDSVIETNATALGAAHHRGGDRVRHHLRPHH